MKFLLDQDVYCVTARFLSDRGHNVIQVAQLGLSQASDEEILTTAQEQNRILITIDICFFITFTGSNFYFSEVVLRA
jgi:predicted nuclease of predicted toxin-antitoxin system